MSQIEDSESVPAHLSKAILQCLVGDVSYTAFASIINNYGLRAPSKPSYYNIQKANFADFTPILNEILEENRKFVWNHYLAKGEKPVDGKMNIAISSDGCYTKRSYISTFSSKYCICFAIEADTGVVVAYTVQERCSLDECTSSRDFEVTNCPHGKFHGSAKSLEAACVVRLYEESIENKDFPFRYTLYVGDADANVFNQIKTRDPPFYGTIGILKEECQFHFRKRCKIALTGVFKGLKQRTVKKSVLDNSDSPIDFSKLEASDWIVRNAFPDKDKLPDTLALRYASLIFLELRSIRRNNNYSADDTVLDRMSNAIKAIPRHYSDHVNASFEERKLKHLFCRPDFCDFLKTPEEDREQYRPAKDGALYIEEYDETGPVTKAMDIIFKKFDTLADRSIMQRCTRGLTQNNNESLHHRLFCYISKTKFFGFDHVRFAALLASIVHNVGYEKCFGTLFDRIGAYNEQEHKRLVDLDRERKYSGSTKHRLIKNKSRYGKSTKLQKKIDKNGVNYAPGAAFEDLHLDESSHVVLENVFLEDEDPERPLEMTNLVSFNNKADDITTYADDEVL